jgi:ketosteroid isomerase-like protein
MTDLRKTIEDLSRQWMQAWMDQDQAALERLLAPDYNLIVSSLPDQPFDREAWLKTALGPYRCTKFDYRNVQVRDLGSVAAFSAIADQEAQLEGADRSGSFWVTDIWRQSEDGWRVCARYSSRPEQQAPSTEVLEALTH